MSEFQVKSQELSPEVLLVAVEGDLNVSAAESFEHTVSGYLKEGKHKFIFDLSNLTYISSAGVGIFIYLLKEVRENKGKIVMCNPKENVRWVFEAVGLDDKLIFVNTQEEALEALGLS